MNLVFESSLIYEDKFSIQLMYQLKIDVLLVNALSLYLYRPVNPFTNRIADSLFRVVNASDTKQEYKRSLRYFIVFRISYRYKNY